ncbi:MAG: YceK/YidQ family lipoprotein [Methylomicrobium sp.]|nr:YceK/YidQ family lipoprotein [Methylomicrobium sp.]
MKIYNQKWILVGLLGALAVGCSSIRARNDMPETEWKVYPGVRQDMIDMGEVFSSQREEPGWVKGVVTTMLVIDLPISMVFDTVVMPYDIYRILIPEPAMGGGDSSASELEL